MVLIGKSGLFAPEISYNETELDSLHQKYGAITIPQGYKVLFGTAKKGESLFAIAPEVDPERLIFMYMISSYDTEIITKQGLELITRNFDQFEVVDETDTTLTLNGQHYSFKLNYGIFAERFIPMIQLVGVIRTKNKAIIIIVLSSDIEINDVELENIVKTLKLD